MPGNAHHKVPAPRPVCKIVTIFYEFVNFNKFLIKTNLSSYEPKIVAPHDRTGKTGHRVKNVFDSLHDVKNIDMRKASHIEEKIIILKTFHNIYGTLKL